jgi:hypothetical protein
MCSFIETDSRWVIRADRTARANFYRQGVTGVDALSVQRENPGVPTICLPPPTRVRTLLRHICTIPNVYLKRPNYIAGEMDAAWRLLHQEIHAAFTRWGGGDPMLLDLRAMCTHCVDMRLVCLLEWVNGQERDASRGAVTPGDADRLAAAYNAFVAALDPADQTYVLPGSGGVVCALTASIDAVRSAIAALPEAERRVRGRVQDVDVGQQHVATARRHAGERQGGDAAEYKVLNNLETQ